MGVGGQSLLVRWGRWVQSLREIRWWVRRGGTGHTAGEGGHPSINRVSGSSLPDIGPVNICGMFTFESWLHLTYGEGLLACVSSGSP